MDIQDKQKIKEHFNQISGEYDYWKKKNYYYGQLKAFYKKHIPPGAQVIEIGSATGDVLAAVNPKQGVGVDISFKMAQLAKEKYPEMRFFVSDAEALALKRKFKYAIMPDLIDHVYDIWKVIEEQVKESMRILHVIGNKIFGIIFSFLLGQRITDTLCGTKAFLKRDYEKFKFLSKAGPWGDFDLLLGAAKAKLTIVEIPVRYQKRIFGYSKMMPFKHGFILFLRVLRAFKEIYLEIWFKKITRPFLFK